MDIDLIRARKRDLALTDNSISEELLEVIKKYSQSPNRPCGCGERGPHRKVCPESSDIPARVLLSRYEVLHGVLAERRDHRIH